MTANDILAVAKSQLGVKESPAGSNKCKYCTEYGVTTAWCVIFLWWCFKQAGTSSLFYGGKKCASCSVLMGWAKSNKQWITKGYRPGDLLLYDWNGDGKPEHIGICTAVSGSTLTAIEGNTAVGNDSNGGQVMERTRKVSQVLGAVRPKYETASGATATKTEDNDVKIPVIKKGSKGAMVKATQILLNGYGYNCGTADGDFGAKTDAAVRKYQAAKKLTVDGEVGEKTFCSLTGV